jgi:hypothetical protein
MKNRILVAMAVFAALATASFAITITSWSTDKASYGPGDSGYITLNVAMSTGLNTGETITKFKSVSAQSYSSFTDYYQTFGEMAQGNTMITIPIEIGDNTPEGIYTVVAGISGIVTIGKGGVTSDSMDSGVASIIIKVVSRPVMTLEASQKNIGKNGNIGLTLCAKKGTPRNIQVSSSLYLEGGKIYLDTLGRGNCTTMNVSYDASGLSEGTSNIAFNLSYSDTLGGTYSETVYIPMTVSKEAGRFIISQTGTITNRENGALAFTVENKGDVAQDVRITPGSSITLTKSSEIEAGNMAGGQKESFSEIAYTSLEPGVNVVNFTMHWKENGQDKSDTINVPITVESKDSIDIYMEANPSPLTAGGEHTLSVVVANKASYGMDGVSVSIDSNSFDVLDVEKRKFIGSINNDDFSSQQFKIRVAGSPPENSSVEITVSFKDPSGVEHVKTTEVPINIKAAERSGDGGMLAIISIAVVAVAAYLLFKKRKEAKK